MKTRKIRLLSALLALAMLLALLPTAAFADDGNNKCGEDLTWKLDSDGTLTISGTGAMEDYGRQSNQSAPWSGKNIINVVIGDGVTTIGKYAFQDCTNLKNVTFPSSIETIEKWAFYGCVALESVDLSHLNDLEQIKSNAFNNCAALKTVKLPQNGKLNTIGVDAFSFTNSQPAPQITEITIPASVTTIGDGAFEGCSKLKKVTFAPNSGLQTIGTDAFGRCHKDLIICYSNESVKTALTNASVSPDIIKPTKPTVTFDFDNGTEAENKQVENGEKVTPPTAPTKNGYIFAGWYTKDKNENWAENQFDFINTAIMDNMTLYAKWTPGGTCGVGGKLTWKLDGGTLTISGTGEMADYRGNTPPWNDHKSQITKLVVEEGVTSIGDVAFLKYWNLRSVELHEGLEEIGDFAFSCCVNPNPGSENLESIHIPSTVTKIGSGCFSGCKTLKEVTFEPGSKLETIGENAFSDCHKDLIIYYSNKEVKQALTGAGVSADRIKPEKPTVTFDFDNGTEAENKQVKNGEKVTPPTAPTKEDYIFAGWYTKDESGKWAAKPFDFSTPIMDNMTLYARWGVEATPITPAIRLYPITIDYGTAYDAEGNPIEKAAAGDVVTIEASETALEGMAFERWEVRKGNVTLENDRAAQTSFTMPAGEVQLEAMYQAAEVHDSGWDAATVVTGVAVGTGTAVLAYHIGMEVYAEQVLGKDVAVPRTRAEVALLAWQLAGSPAVNVEGEPLSEAAQAQRWAVESGLMQKDAEGNFNGTKKMSKWNALRTLDAAKKMG